MSIESEITRLQSVKSNILHAIADKGVEVPSGSMLADCPGLIASISSGGVSNAVIGGRIYSTVIIGGKEWITENLDFKFRGLIIGNSGTSTSVPRGNYYDNDEITYGVSGKNYGILYNWYAVNYLESNRSSLIPGWHIPSADEWDELATAVGGASGAGAKLKSSIGWTSGAGTNEYGFSALPSGFYYGAYGGIDTQANFWTSTYYDTNKAVCRFFNTGNDMNKSNSSDADQYAVRLVKDS